MTDEEKKAHLKAYRKAYHARMRIEQREKLREYYERQKSRGHCYVRIADRPKEQ